MENTPKKVAKPRLQLVISVLVATSLVLAELYVMINQPANFVLMIGIAVLVLIAVYFVIDAVMDCVKEKDIVTREQYDTIYRSEKASYMLLKKNLEEISHLIQEANGQSGDTEEIVNAQKALAKISMNKSKENADRIVAKVAELEQLLGTGHVGGSTPNIDTEKQDRLFIELNNLEASLNDRLQGLSDKLSGFQEEIERLADHIAKINTEAISEALNNRPETQNLEFGEDDLDFGDLDFGDISLSEESDDIGISAFADMDVLEGEDTLEDSLADLLAEAESAEVVSEDVTEDILADALVEETPVEEDSVPEPVEEPEPAETVPAPEPAANPNKMMTPEEIAALIANM